MAVIPFDPSYLKTPYMQTSWLYVLWNRSYGRSKFYIAGIQIFDLFAPVTLNLTRWPSYMNLTHLEIYWMCKYELPMSRISKVIIWQTDATEIICHAVLRVVGMTCTNFIQCTAHSSTSNWIQVAVASDVQPHINLICSSNTNDTFIQSVCYCLAVPTQWYVVFTVSSLLIFCQKFSQVVWCFVSTLKSALHEPTDGPSCRPNPTGRPVSYSTTQADLMAVGLFVPPVIRHLSVTGWRADLKAAGQPVSATCQLSAKTMEMSVTGIADRGASANMGQSYGPSGRLV